jgi:hypothetical protein
VICCAIKPKLSHAQPQFFAGRTNGELRPSKAHSWARTRNSSDGDTGEAPSRRRYMGNPPNAPSAE